MILCRAGRPLLDSGQRRRQVFILLLFVWVLPALLAAFHEGSPFLEGFRRVAGPTAARPGLDSQEQLKQLLVQTNERLPRDHEVVPWIEEVPHEQAALVSQLVAWITATYLLYPRRVFPLSTPGVIQQLETRQAISSPLAAFMRLRATALANNDRWPALGILVWDRPPPCHLRTLPALSRARLLVVSPGGCVFATGREEQ